MDFFLDEEKKTMTCVFSGHMDAARSAEAGALFDEQRKKVSQICPEELEIVFDLKAVDYIASAFIRLCLIAAKSVETGAFSIVNTDPHVKKVFKLTGLETAMNIS